LEDCWHLSQLLPDCKGNLSTAELVEAFKRYSDKRQARTSMLVKGARAQGELRVMAGEEECRQRNQKVRDMFANDRVIVAGLHNLYSEPF
jgi:salicylate hydroxylase